jgi:PAS domain S-box-containing protein
VIDSPERARRAGSHPAPELGAPEETVQLLMQSVQDLAIIALDADGRVASWNAGAERILGYATAEIVGEHVSRLYGSDDVAALKPQRLLDEVRQRGRAEDEGWRVRKDGSRFWANAVITPIVDERGAVRGFAKMTRDVTERRRLTFLGEASALLSASLDYETTLASVARLSVPFLADWALVQLLEGERLRTMAIAHVDPRKVELGWALDRRFPVEPGIARGPWHVLETGRAEVIEPISYEHLVATVEDGEARRAIVEMGVRSALIVPLIAQERPLGVITYLGAESGHHYDEGTRRLAEEVARRAALAIANARAHQELERERARLEREAQFRERFVAILGHDLRNPLAAILNSAHLLLRRELAEPERRAAARVAASAERMSRMISEVLDLARSRQGGGIPIAPRPLSLREVCREVVEELRVAHPGAELALDAETAALGTWDGDRLAQAISNIAANAIRYGRKDGPVRLQLGDDGKEVRVSVHNEGAPIPPELLPNLFDPFRRGSAPAGAEPAGLGLGLYIAHQIVLAHGGSIEVRPCDGGTTFVLRLPRRRG